MRDLVVTTFITLDGVMESPQEWSFPFWNDDVGQFKLAELQASGPQLLGRVTYEGFAVAWPSRSGDVADLLNTLPKVVVSSTLRDPEWKPVQVIAPSDLELHVGKLKAEAGRNVLVHGSLRLTQELLRRGLVDELHLVIFPIVLGHGRRLFAEGQALKFELAKSQTTGTGVVIQILRPIGT